jgi:taurine dioxygenase
VKVVPTGAALGAEIGGVDLRRVDAGVMLAVHRAWLTHQVLLFRGQRLDNDDLVAFSRLFGELDEAPVQESGRRFVEGHPEIYVVSNVVEQGVPIGSLGSGEAVWHTDMSYLPLPPKASILYALEIPRLGGDTSFCNMTSAWDTLPPDLRARAAGRRVKHDGTYNSGGYLREGVTASDDPVNAPGENPCGSPRSDTRCADT